MGLGAGRSARRRHGRSGRHLIARRRHGGTARDAPHDDAARTVRAKSSVQRYSRSRPPATAPTGPPTTAPETAPSAASPALPANAAKEVTVIAAASAVVASHRIVIFIPSSRCEQYRKRKQNPRYSVPFVGLSEPLPILRHRRPADCHKSNISAGSESSPRTRLWLADLQRDRRQPACQWASEPAGPAVGVPVLPVVTSLPRRLTVRRPAMCHAAMVRPEPTARNARTRGVSDHPARHQADWTADDRPRKRPKGSIAGPLLGGGPKRCRSHGSSYYGYRCKQSLIVRSFFGRMYAAWLSNHSMSSVTDQPF